MIDASMLIAFVSIALSALSFFMNWKKSNKADATEITTVIVKLENISTDTKEIKTELKSVRSEVGELRERVIVAEQAAKSLHHRVDALESRFDYADK